MTSAAPTTASAKSTSPYNASTKPALAPGRAHRPRIERVAHSNLLLLSNYLPFDRDRILVNAKHNLENDEGSKVNIMLPSRFDSRLMLELCLRSIQNKTDYPDFDITVCDAGVDDDARSFLEGEARAGSIRLIQATDSIRPKDDLAAAADAPFYVLIHDDTYIRRRDWLCQRMRLMLSSPANATIGRTCDNYKTKGSRYFPMGLLVRSAAAAEMGFKWGKQKDLDTGAIAYRTLLAQSKYRHIEYKGTCDIHHFSRMTWPKREDASLPNIQELLRERDIKLGKIREMLRTGSHLTDRD
jgi:hypothetical protein